MLLKPYRETLALPGIKSLLVVATLARIPIAAGAVVLTLHVVTDLKMGYGAAGLVGAAFTVGGSLGAPVMGRLTDRGGLRPVLVLTTVAEVLFWSLAQGLPYWGLLFAAFAGFLALPAFSVSRQSIAALTPESHRLPAFALDSITTELSFMTGPALGVLIATGVNPRAAMFTLAAGILLAGVGLWLLNPPIRAAHEAPVTAGERVSRRSWLRPRFVAILAVTMAATLVLSGTDVAVVAVLRASGELSWTGLVMSLWALYSLIGGFAYGTIRRGLPAIVLLTPMALLTIPVGLGGSHWWLLALLLIPAGALCAPTITASADAVSRLTPASARGEAMGLHNSSLTVGVALGGPVAGLAIDKLSAPWGFAAVGALGLVVALFVLPAELRRHRATTTEPTTTEPITTEAVTGSAAWEAAVTGSAATGSAVTGSAAREGAVTGSAAREGAVTGATAREGAVTGATAGEAAAIDADAAEVTSTGVGSVGGVNSSPVEQIPDDVGPAIPAARTPSESLDDELLFLSAADTLGDGAAGPAEVAPGRSDKRGI